MARRVSRRVEDLHWVISKGERIPVAVLDIDTRYAAGIRAWTDDLAAGLGFEFRVAARMVSVVVRIKNVCETPALLGERRTNGCGRGRVDRSCQPAIRIVNQKAVVVAKAGKHMDVDRLHDSVLGDCMAQARPGMCPCGLLS
jgi:hypothetical protein